MFVPVPERERLYPGGGEYPLGGMEDKTRAGDCGVGSPSLPVKL